MLAQAEAEEKLQSLVLKQVRKRVRLVLDGKRHTPPAWSVGILVAYISKRSALTKPRQPRPSKQLPRTSKADADKPEAKRRHKTKDQEAADVNKAKRRRKKKAQQTVGAKSTKISIVQRGKDVAEKIKCKANSRTIKSHTTSTKIKSKPKLNAGQEAHATDRKFPPRHAKYNSRIVVRVTDGRYHCVRPNQSCERKTPSIPKARSSVKVITSKTHASSKETAVKKTSAKVAQLPVAAVQPKRRGRPPSIKVRLSRGNKCSCSSLNQCSLQHDLTHFNMLYLRSFIETNKILICCYPVHEHNNTCCVRRVSFNIKVLLMCR